MTNEIAVKPPLVPRVKQKVAEKKRGNWPVIVLLAVTVGLSLLFYVKNIQWGRLNLNINFDWLGNLFGSLIVTFEK